MSTHPNIAAYSEMPLGSARWKGAIFELLASFGTAAALGLLALSSGRPFVFPSLGATVFLLFHKPAAPPACPRNVLGGHALGAFAGWLALALFGLIEHPSAFVEGMSVERVWAAALSLGLTSGGMSAANIPHPPAGATTLIVALGLIRTPADILVLMSAIAAAVILAMAIHRAAGRHYPLWAPPPVPNH